MVEFVKMFESVSTSLKEQSGSHNSIFHKSPGAMQHYIVANTVKEQDGSLTFEGDLLLNQIDSPTYELIRGIKKVDGSLSLFGLDLVDLRIIKDIVEVVGDFDCSDNKLRSLKGCPRIVGQDFFCNDNEIISLVGCSKKIGGDFDCTNNEIVSLRGVPRSIGGTFECAGNLLNSLEYAPSVGPDGSFNCNSCGIISLEGCPKTIGRTFDCSNNNLKTLEDGPEIVYSDYACYSNMLRSLKGVAEYIGGDLECQNNRLRSLEGIDFVSGRIIAGGNYATEGELLKTRKKQ